MAVIEPRPSSTRRRGSAELDAWDKLALAVGRWLPNQPQTRLFWSLVVLHVVLSLLWLNKPDGSLIFDEKYYVNASRVILGITPDAGVWSDRPLGLDPNTEHPPLAKLITALTMAIFGDNAWGWRIPSVIFGTIVIACTYPIVLHVSRDPWVALLATALLTFENLMFVHGRIFTLDISMVAFMMVGLWFYVRERSSLAGAGFALAALCKIGGVFAIPAIAAYEAIRVYRTAEGREEAMRLVVRRLLRVGLSFTLVFFVLLTVMDNLWVGYATPIEHLYRIYSYGTALRRPAGPSGVESHPWQWLWNERTIPYLKVDQQVKVGDEVRETRPVIYFLGAMNPYVLTLLPLGFALAISRWRRPGHESDLPLLSVCWAFFNFVPFLAAALLGQRISYIFYFLPTVPAIAWAGAVFLLRSGLPRTVVAAYLFMVIAAFADYFPFRIVP